MDADGPYFILVANVQFDPNHTLANGKFRPRPCENADYLWYNDDYLITLLGDFHEAICCRRKPQPKHAVS